MCVFVCVRAHALGLTHPVSRVLFVAELLRATLLPCWLFCCFIAVIVGEDWSRQIVIRGIHITDSIQAVFNGREIF